ncbi:MAG: ATP-binding protein [Gammaproteobacteria bacterium]|nr:ATP-binding protein [Gammaproteobacteria bacterium]
MPMETPQKLDDTELDLAQLRPDVRLLSDAFAFTRNAAVINLVVAGILSASLWVKFERYIILAWVVTVVAVQASRIATEVRIENRDLLALEPALTFRLLLGGSFASGLGWGIALPLMGEHLPVVWQLLVVIVIAGLASGAISTLGNSLVLLMAFIFAAVIPASLWLFMQGDALSRVVSLLALVYAANLAILGRGTARRARELAQLAYENSVLARDLLHEKHAVDEANRELRRAFGKQRKVESELREHRDSLEQIVATQTADLTRAKEIAEAASLAKSEFLANISHELRTPMHAILSFATIGGRKANEGTALHKYFRRIHESGHRLLLLLNDLLDLSKMDSGRVDFEPGDLDPMALLDCAYAEIESLFGDKNLRLEVQRETPVADCLCYGDRKLLLQLFTNLFSNAIKFAPQDTCIIVTLARMAQDERDGVVIGVRDHGVGIPEAELDRVFDRFAQSSLTKTGAGGTGLGLAICKTIVDHHEGRLWAEATDKGALFRVWLPAPVGFAGAGVHHAEADCLPG